MIRRALAALVLIPLTILIVLLALGNRQGVTVSLDPFLAEPRALAVTLPLFMLILLVLTAGVVIGGVAAWLRQSKWRRSARHAQAELRQLRAETQALRERLDAAERPAQSLPSIAYRRPPAA
jgi:uncharacterized integral membrane protein